MNSIESGYGYLPIYERHPEDCGCEYCDEPEPCEACGDMPEDCNCFECEECHKFGPLEPSYDLCPKCAEVFEISLFPLVGAWAKLVGHCIADMRREVKNLVKGDGTKGVRP